METRARAVLFRAGGLGDLLVALPSVSLVRRALAEFHLTLAARPEYGAVLEAAGIVDEVVAFDDPVMAALFAHDGRPIPGAHNVSGSEANGENGAPPVDFGRIADRKSKDPSFREFDLALGWLNRRGGWPDESEWARRGVERAFFVPYDTASGVPMSRNFFDRTFEYLRSSASAPLIARPAGSGEADDETKSEKAERGAKERRIAAPTASQDGLFDDCARLTLGRDLVRRALDSLGLRPLGATGRRLVVHPGSGGRAKRWPLGNFVEVVRRAAARGVEGVLVTGEAEADLEREIARLALPTGWARASRLSAMTLAGLLAASTHYIGNDSGPTHLAAACGASVIAVFVDANLPTWRPFGRTRVLSAAAVERVPLEAALAELDGFLGG